MFTRKGVLSRQLIFKCDKFIWPRVLMDFGNYFLWGILYPHCLFPGGNNTLTGLSSGSDDCIWIIYLLVRFLWDANLKSRGKYVCVCIENGSINGSIIITYWTLNTVPDATEHQWWITVLLLKAFEVQWSEFFWVC